jgi:predicted metal-binding membrane protein
MLRHGLDRGALACHVATSWPNEVFSWTAMVMAMMVPTLVEGMRDVSLRSYRVRRHRAIVMYVVGYLACWLAAGLPVAVLRQWPATHDRRAATVAFMFAAGWSLLPWRARWHVRCHRKIALAPTGCRADLDALRQGAVNGVPCVVICWPLMVACALTGHELLAMVGGACLTLVEKRMFRPRPLPIALGAGALAAWTLVVAS